MRLTTLAVALSLAMATGIAQAASPVVVDAAGVILGFYHGPKPSDSGSVLVVTTKGYIARYDRVTGVLSFETPHPWDYDTFARIQGIYYQSNDCSGDPYLPASETFTGGTVAAQQFSGIRYYVPKNSTGVTFVTMSRRNQDGICQPGQHYSGVLVRTYLNDPNVTGVTNEPAIGPLRIEVATITESSFDVFRDGFEPIQPTWLDTFHAS